MTNHILTTWLTQSDAARRLGVSREAIRQAIAAGRIDWNGRTGRDCRVRGELLPARTLPPLTRAPKTPAKTPDFSPGETGSSRAPKGSANAPKGSISNAPKGSISNAPKGSISSASKGSSAPKAPIPADKLLEARLQKLEADTAIQMMRLESNRREIYAQVMTDFQTAYESAFAPLKKFLISLDLPVETLRKLAEIADQCDADFQSKIP